MKKFLIISANAIGDTYLSLSGANELIKIFPDAQIDFFIKPNSTFLFSDLEIVNNIFVYHNIYNLLTIGKKIVNKRYDFSFNFFPGRLNTLINLISNAKLKSGYWNLLPLKDWSSSNQVVNSTVNNNLKIIWGKEDNYLELINLVFKKINFPFINTTKFIYPTTENYKHKTREYLLIHSCSKNQNRSFSNSHIQNLVSHLLKKFLLPIIIISDKNDRNAKFLESLITENVKLLKNPSIKDLIKLIREAKLFLGIDSFPLHLADAYNGPFIGIFAPTNPSSVLINSQKSIRFEGNSLFNIPDEKFISTIMKKVSEIDFY